MTMQDTPQRFDVDGLMPTLFFFLKLDANISFSFFRNMRKQLPFNSVIL
jgi:hypothetical protein